MCPCSQTSNEHVFFSLQVQLKKVTENNFLALEVMSLGNKSWENSISVWILDGKFCPTWFCIYEYENVLMNKRWDLNCRLWRTMFLWGDFLSPSSFTHPALGHRLIPPHTFHSSPIFMVISGGLQTTVFCWASETPRIMLRDSASILWDETIFVLHCLVFSHCHLTFSLLPFSPTRLYQNGRHTLWTVRFIHSTAPR